jgi:peroxiredoxin (alkyl hydroperoxide reductase subunit C)
VIRLEAEVPDFELEGVAGAETVRFRLSAHRGRWVMLFFYPADFTFICPTEVLGFDRLLGDFEASGAVVAGISVDDLASHRQWAAELGGLRLPLLSDPGGAACRTLGVLNEDDGRAHRSTLIVAPDGKLAYLVASPANVGRSVEETLRVLRALQTGRLCPADWRPGSPTGDPELRY